MPAQGATFCLFVETDAGFYQRTIATTNGSGRDVELDGVQHDDVSVFGDLDRDGNGSVKGGRS